MWNLSKKKCWRIFKHSYAINCVAINDVTCVTGGVNGHIKVFTLLDGKLVKVYCKTSYLIFSFKYCFTNFFELLDNHRSPGSNQRH